MLKNYSPSIRRELLLFSLICLFSLFFRIKIIHELPLGVKYTEYGLQGFDDEPAHLNYSKYLLVHKTLPIETSTIYDTDAFEINEFEYHQPPLYYITISTMASFLGFNSDYSILLLGRYLNVLISAISIFIIYLIFIKLGIPLKSSLLGCAFILLLGSQVYHTSLFSNDALSWLIIWGIFYFILKGSIKHWLQITVLLIIGHYSKTSILIIYPVLLWSFIRAHLNMEKNTTRNAFVILIVPLAISFPWYYRNFVLYGSFLNLAGIKWHFVSSYLESLQRIIHVPYSIFFKMYFVPPKSLIIVFNYIQYITFIPLMAAGIWKLGKNLKHDRIQLSFILFFITLFAYIWLALPTGFTEGRLLFPTLPIMIYFLLQYPLFWQKKFELPEYIIMLFVILIMIPQFIIGFYF